MTKTSFRSRLRAFQAVRGDPLEPNFVSDLEFLENRDMDLSIRLGAMLAFNALMITIGTHPISASPGAPLSLDAATQRWEVIACCAALLPLVVSCTLCLRAILFGEEFDSEGLEGDVAIRQRLFAAFIRSIDVQHHNLRASIHWTLAGGAMTILVWIWIMGTKMAG